MVSSLLWAAAFLLVAGGRCESVLWGRFWPAVADGYALLEDCEVASCCWRSAFALRRLSSIRRTCSGVMGEFVVAAGRRGGVVGRCASAILNSDHEEVQNIRPRRATKRFFVVPQRKDKRTW
jgi:hypothetical protein